uniref:Uncharacterized protein n=1 Tax=Heterorhabditis bacteriophora TaxID=37862 RepID=A0A1I7WG06_HETBA
MVLNMYFLKIYHYASKNNIL